MRMENQSTAYDFARFSPRQQNVVALPKQQKKNAAAVKKSKQNKVFARVFVSAIVLTMVMAWIFSRVQLTEVTAQINSIEKQLNQLKSEQVRMEMEFESKMSAKKIEEYAVNVLGMKKIESAQIEYIYVNEGDRIVLIEDGNQNLISRIGKSITGFLSYDNE